MTREEFEEISGVYGIKSLYPDHDDICDWCVWNEKRSTGEYVASWGRTNGYDKFRVKIASPDGSVTYDDMRVYFHVSRPWKVQISRSDEDISVMYGCMDPENEWHPPTHKFWSFRAPEIFCERTYNEETCQYELVKGVHLEEEVKKDCYLIALQIFNEIAAGALYGIDPTKEIMAPQDDAEEFTKRMVEGKREELFQNILTSANTFLTTANRYLLQHQMVSGINNNRQ